MRLLLAFLLWCLVLIFCWPLAILAVVFFPILWVLALPFRFLGVVVGAVLQLFKAILYFPARLLEPKKGVELRPG